MGRTKGIFGKIGIFTDKRKLTTVLIAILVVLAVIFLFRNNLAKLFSRADEADSVITNQTQLGYIDSQSSPQTVLSNITTTVITTPIPQSPSPSLPVTSPSLPATAQLVSLQMYANQEYYDNAWAMIVNTSSNPLDANSDVIFSKEIEGQSVEKTWEAAYNDGWVGNGQYWDVFRQGLSTFGPDSSFSSFTEVQPGQSFWLQIYTNGLTMKMTLDTPTQQSFSLAMSTNQEYYENAWAMVGSIFNSPLDANSDVIFSKEIEGQSVEKTWEAAYNDGWVGNGQYWEVYKQGLHTFGPDSSFSELTEVQPGQGFWLQVYTNGLTMKVSP